MMTASKAVKRDPYSDDTHAVDFDIYKMEPAEERRLAELYLDALKAEGIIKDWNRTEGHDDCRTFEIHALDGSVTKAAGTYFTMIAGQRIELFEQFMRGEVNDDREVTE